MDIVSLTQSCRHVLISTSPARTHVMSVLEVGVKHGQLLIEDHEGQHIYGEAECKRPVTMTIRCDDIWARIVLSLDMGRKL